MASVNKWLGIGNLGADPEIRYMQSGDAIANFSIACTDQWKDKDGEKKERTEWVRVSVFGRLAEICGEYLRKGSQVYIEGRLQTDKYTDKDGVEKYSTKVVCNTMRMLGGKPADAGERTSPAPSTAPTPSGFDDLENDTPF